MRPSGSRPDHGPAKRRRLLLLAPTCDGEDVGEAWIAFQWTRRLVERHDVTLLTYHKRGKTPAAQQLPGARVVEWTEPPLLGRAERLNSLLKPGYLWYHRQARRWIRDAQRRGERFDLAHQVVPLAMRYPTPVAGLGIPYIIGPVGGSLDNPPGFDEDDDHTPWYVNLRTVDRTRMRFDPLMRRSYDGAECVIGIAPYTMDVLSCRSPKRFETLPDTGIDQMPPLVDRTGANDPVRLLYVGRVVRTKGLRDSILAMSQLRPDTRVVLDVVGDGFDRVACERLTERLGLGDTVRFHGWLPRAAIGEFYRAADAFVFPSYREPGGTVVFESMGYGLPLIVAERGGPGSATDDSCAIRVPVVDGPQFVAGIADAMQRLIDDPALRRRLGENARRRVAQVGLWDGKVDRMDEIYDEVLHDHAAGWARRPLSSSGR